MSEYMEQINDLASQIMRGEKPEAFNRLLEETKSKIDAPSPLRKPRGRKVKRPLKSRYYKEHCKRWSIEDLREVTHSDEAFENGAKLAGRIGRTQGSVNKMKSRIMRHLAYRMGMAHHEIKKLNRRAKNMKPKKNQKGIFMKIVDKFLKDHCDGSKTAMDKVLEEVGSRQRQHKPERYMEDLK